MKLHRVVFSYAVKITDEPFTGDDGRTFEKTARVTFRDDNKNLLDKKKYGVIEIEKLYASIAIGEDIDLSNCYINNFSSSEYRKQNGLDATTHVALNNFRANNAFFEADKLVDFSYCKFVGEQISFNGAHFGAGNLSYHKSIFEGSSVDFSNTNYSEGNNTFQFVQFGNGKLTFENASFINGNISFINANFGDGKANFKHVHFGNGNVEFQFSKFGKGQVSFERVRFNGELVDFSKVEFGDGRLDFRRADFGNAEVSFREIEHGKDRVNFRRAHFGDRPISFEMAIFGDVEVVFDESEFGSGDLSLLNCSAQTISFKKCQLSNYLDLRVDTVDSIDLSNTVIRDIIDFKPGVAPVNLKRLYIQGVRIIGKIFISWSENKVWSLIGEQEDTNDYQKAEQYRILKEEFHNSGRYNDEDKAYVQFKRHELTHHTTYRLEQGGIKKALAYPAMWVEYLIFDKMGLYATSPFRVLLSLFVVYTFYSLLFVFMPFIVDSGIMCNGDTLEAFNFGDSFYYSAITFLTVGYGECLPEGFFKILAPIEGWSGVFMMSYFTVAFVRKILR